MKERPCRPSMTTGGWLAQEKDHPINEEAEKWDDSTFSAINRPLEEHAKSDPLAALESLPRARWWEWLRRKIARWID